MNKIKIVIMQIAVFCFARHLFGETVNGNSQCTKHVIVTGTAQKAQIFSDNQDSIEFKVPVDISFINCSEDPIFIFQDQDSEGRGYPWGGGSTIYDSKENVEQNKYLCKRGAWPSDSRSMKMWQEIRDVLDTTDPPNEYIRVIKPGESWDYGINVPLSFQKRQDPQNPLNNGCESWDVIKEKDELWLQKAFTVWPFNIEQYDSLEYGRSLQNKWKGKGHLILDNYYIWDILISEPIPINLREAVNQQ